MKTKKRITEADYLRANRKASREEELALHGRPVRRGGVHKSKKAYDRNKQKANKRQTPRVCLLIFRFVEKMGGKVSSF